MRLPFACSGRLIRTQLGKARFAAVLVEPIVGREGVLVPPDGWLAELADACQATGTLLIADEIFTGFGRTGTWFTVERDGVRPDLLCCGKALAGGLPIGAVVGRRAVMEAWRAPGEARHTATFLAHPLACAAGLACLQEIEDRRLPRRAARLGEWLGTRIGDWADRFAPVTAVRGRGLLWGIETTTAEQAKRLAAAAWRRGLLVLAGGAEGRVLQLAPPLVIAERQLSHAVDLLTAILTTDPDAGAAP